MERRETMAAKWNITIIGWLLRVVVCFQCVKFVEERQQGNATKIFKTSMVPVRKTITGWSKRARKKLGNEVCRRCEQRKQEDEEQIFSLSSGEVVQGKFKPHCHDDAQRLGSGSAQLDAHPRCSKTEADVT